jgi:hypothetical protein
MFTRDDQKDTKSNTKTLAVMGFTLAVLLGVVAYFTAPALIDFGASQNSNLEETFTNIEDEFGAQVLDYIAAGLLWLLLFIIFMLVAAAMTGPDPERESLKQMGPSPANKKAMVKQLKKDLRKAKRQARQREKSGKKRQ